MKKVKLSTLKLRDKFQVPGSNKWYRYYGSSQQAGWHCLEDMMTGQRYTWLGRTEVLVTGVLA